MPQPRSLHVVGHAASQKPTFTCPRFFISDVCEFAFFTWIMLIPWYYLFYDLPPGFAVQLAPVIGRLLDVSPAFHVALHAGNRRATERCYHHGEGVVAYAGFTIASGRVPGFCVQGKRQREVPFLLARQDGVDLPEHLRDRMATAHKVGALELEVQVRLFQGGDAATGRPTWMWCKVRMGGAQPQDRTVCTVFALQSWFDFSG
ncbi:hypothetical protein ACP70R_038185 [Stipagrostis hirtigluma subsp. patula]